MKDEYDDEDLINLRQKFYYYEENIVRINDKEENKVENGSISIEGYKILFSEREIKNKIIVMLPTEYEQMEDRCIQIKYPAYKGEDRIILTNEETTINFMFEFSEKFLDKSDLEEVSTQLFSLIKKVNPSLVLLEKFNISLYFSEVICFEMITPAIDKDIYNLMYFFIVDKNLVVGSFNCYNDERSEWQPTIRQVIESIQLVDNDDIVRWK